LLAAAALLLTAPLLAAIAIGIRISDRGPIFYVAERVGAKGARFPTFRMIKFRTMRIAAGPASRITRARDPRVFAFGRWLRRLKLDELPQLVNIIRGDMAFVGPRPEDPWFVDRYYTRADRETLEVLPGLTSPGTLYYFKHAEPLLDSADPEAAYVSGPLQAKLALDRAYVHQASPIYDLRLAVETIWVLGRVAVGRRS
jgi:lipopolysaccharide/colanic/teichoic acid biosynthesis glycosyltransferase